MTLIAPDVLAEAQGLSPAISGIGALLGSLLWFCGWRWHRFWIVVAVTLAGGLIGLQTGKSSGGHILAMGVLLGLSAGLLALELARVFSFIAAGMAFWMAANALFPKGQELWVAFLVGGFLGVLLYRFWTMLLTSFIGVLLSWHSILCLVERLVPFDAANFAESQSTVLNGAVLAMTVLGVLVQSWLERWHVRRQKRFEEEALQKVRQEEREKMKSETLPVPPPTASKRSFWDKVLRRKK